MRTLKDLKQNIEEILKKYPEWENLPLIFSSDDEGNSFHKLNNELTPMQVEDVNKYYLEPVLLEDEEEIINCICIN